MSLNNKLINGALFHDSLANNWSSGYNSAGFRKRFIFISTYLSGIVEKNEQWIDAGCGTGVLSREIERLGAFVSAVDGSAEMIKVAIDETSNSSNRITYQHISTIERLPFQDSCYEGILCSSVIEYVDMPDRVLFEFSRVLKPNGVVIITVPNRFSVIRRIQFLVRNFFKLFGVNFLSYLSVSINDYSGLEINSALKKHNLIVEDQYIFDPILPSLTNILRIGSLRMVVARKLN